jgi:quercetin dioxygenase-like cupin family protein
MEMPMSLHHAESGDLIDIRPLGSMLDQSTSSALFRTDQLEAMRLVLPVGKEIPEHQVNGDFTLQCIEGAVEMRVHGKSQAVRAGEMIFIAANEPYAIRALENASLLMTLVRNPGPG